MKKIQIILDVILFVFSIYVAYVSVALYVNCSLNMKYSANSMADVNFAFFCSKIFLIYLTFLAVYFILKKVRKVWS